MQDIKKELDCGIVLFSYYKADESLRMAIGTRCEKFISEFNADKTQPEENERYRSEETCCYFDIIRNAWRCFRYDRFNRIIDSCMSKENASVSAIVIALRMKDSLISCLYAVDTLVGNINETKILSHIVAHPMEGYDGGYVKQCCESVFPGSPMHVDAVENTHLSSKDRRKELVERLIQLREEETKILEELLLT